MSKETCDWSPSRLTLPKVYQAPRVPLQYEHLSEGSNAARKTSSQSQVEVRLALRSERWAIRAMLHSRASKAAKAGHGRLAAVLRELAQRVWERRQKWEE